MSYRYPWQKEKPPEPETITVEKCDDDVADIAKKLGTFGDSYDKVAADELRTLIADRGKKRKFGGSR